MVVKFECTKLDNLEGL